MNAADDSRTWPAEGLTRVPYWVYQDPDNYQAELRRILKGPTWSYVGLKHPARQELPELALDELRQARAVAGLCSISLP
jgi:hypothetical protein